MAGDAGARCPGGNGALCAGGLAVGCDGGGAEASLAAGRAGGGTFGISADVGKPVGPVFLGSTAVGAAPAMVSFKSGGRLLAGCGGGGAVGTDKLAEP